MRRMLILALLGVLAASPEAGSDPAAGPVLDLQFPASMPALRGLEVEPAPVDDRDRTVPVHLRLPLERGTALVTDGSAATNHAAAAGSAFWSSFGPGGGALALDGGDGHATVPDARSLSFGTGPNDRAFTVSAWVWMKDATLFTAVAKGDDREWRLGTDARDRLTFVVFSGHAKARAAWTVAEPVTALEGQWHHLAAVYSGGAPPNMSASLYLDGRKVAAAAASAEFAGVWDTASPLLAGWGGERPRSLGYVDGIRLDPRALTAEEVEAIRAAAVLPAPFEGVRARAAVAFPAPCEFGLDAGTNRWTDLEALALDVRLPADGPTNAQVLVYVKDWDYLWYQFVVPEFLVPGATNEFRIPLSPEADGWQPVDHYGRWNLRALAAPKDVTVRVFCPSAWTGTCSLERVEGVLKDPRWDRPQIRDVRAASDRVDCYGKFEVAFRLPDRYVDPFDTNVVSVVCLFSGPGAEPVEVRGFYGVEHFRLPGPGGDDRILPQRSPLWRVRFAPPRPGRYEYRLRVRDAGGESTWGPGVFEAAPSAFPGFVRVAARDRRFFEFDDGTPFFPIGHNTRSPFDTRMDGVFPWRQRWDEGSAAYARYFADMGAHGEQIAEVWMAAWSLGLEWNRMWPGYHGVGQYNMRHAWELDQVLDEAARRGIRVNLVLHNHGKFSTFSDPEWNDNPFNAQNGGYLETPEEYFTDPRALESFEKLMTYIVARWGYSPHVFAWELWSELDLTGTNGENFRRPAVVEWHRRMGRFVRQIDPNKHLVGTHVCGDYRHQNEAIISLPEMTHCPIDAYHDSPDPLYIVKLLRETVAFNNRFEKPVLVTEFGGTPHASGIGHLRNTLHAALWSSTALPLGGTPMFWWWGLIEEENYYPSYAAVSRFMADADRRDPALVIDGPPVNRPAGAPPLDLTCMKSPSTALGWLFRTEGFEAADPLGAGTISNVTIRLAGMTNAAYAVEYWHTVKGTALASGIQKPAADGSLELAIPPFARDIAFKIRARP